MNLSLAHSLLDLAFPRACAGCRGRAGDEFHYICWDCLAAIRLVSPPFCLLCGDPGQGDLPEKYFCAACIRQKPFFDCARSAAAYAGLARDLILDFKYHGATWLAPDLGRIMFACLSAYFNAANIDCVTCVPLHRTRARERTYNQAWLLAREVAARLGREALDCLARARATESQTHLTSAARADNVRGKFAARKGPGFLKGRRVLLVDDVMTTGATVNECARVLKESGAQEVLVLTLARG